MWNIFEGWQAKLLSQAGKEVLLKTVAEAIPTFCMSSFLLLVSSCQELEKMMNSFWWGSKINGERYIRGIKWDTCHAPTPAEEGERLHELLTLVGQFRNITECIII